MRRLQAIACIKQFSAGKSIFGEDTAGDCFYIVVAGRVKIFTSSGKRNKTLAYLEKGEFFGEIALLDRQPRSASCQAVESCELLVVKKKDFRALVLKYPRMCLQVLETLSRRLRQADTEIESLAFEDVLGRVAGVLLKYDRQYGKDTPQGRTLSIDINQKEIAELVGTGREVVSRIISRLKRLGCIRYDNKTLSILNAAKLRQFVQ
jgi:CRP/FNR family cyclic AMP-dependent transcriptional regulator